MQSSPPATLEPTESQSNTAARWFGYGRVAFWIMVAVPLAAYFLVTLTWPLARDQGVFAYVGHVIRNGGMPYKDAWEVKGPTALLPYALMELIFGTNMWGIHVFDLFMTAVNMAAVFSIARSWWDRRAGWYAVVILAFCFVTMGFWLNNQPDTWCGALIAVAVALMAGATRSVPLVRFAAAGACVGVCVLEKPIYLIYLLLLLPALIWKRQEGAAWRTVAAATVGFLLPIAAVSGWLAAHRALLTAVDTFLLFNLRTHAALEVNSIQKQFTTFSFWLRSIEPFSTFMFPALLGGLVLVRFGVQSPNKMRVSGRLGRRLSRVPAIMFVLWLLLGLLCVIIQRKYFAYHWYLLLPWLAVGCGIALRQGAEMLLPAPSQWHIRFTVTHVILLWFAFLYVPIPIHYVREWVYYRIGHISRSQYEDYFIFSTRDYYSFPRIEAIANYIRDRTTRGQSVLVWGFDAEINYLSDRPSPTRFEYNYPLAVGANTFYQASYRTEFMKDLNERPPTYIVVADRDQNVLVKPSSKQALADFPEFSNFLNAHYFPETTIDNWAIWRHKQP